MADIAVLDLEVRGMSCASCAGRVERALDELASVRGTVNLATETAHVSFDPAQVQPDQLLAAVTAAGYRAELANTSTAPVEPAGDDLLRRLAVSVPLTVVVVVLQMFVHPIGWRWLALGLAAPVVGYGGWPFHRVTMRNLMHRATTMDTLVSLGTLASFSASVAGAVTDGAMYLDAATVVTTFLLAGRSAEARAKRRASSAVRSLLDLGAKDVTVLRDGAQVRVPIRELAVGDEFLVRPGETVAADGTVVDGSSTLDQSMLTGEAMPVVVTAGGTVTGGTTNLDGALRVRTTAVGQSSRLARISALVAEAQAGKAKVQRLADRVSARFVPAVLAVAALTATAWLLAGADTARALTATVAVLVVACPCALGLATPTAVLVGTGRGAQLGILIRSPEAIDAAASIDTVLLDKTGTLSTGGMRVLGVWVDADLEAAVRRRAAALESLAEHPIARAITSWAGGEPSTTTVTDFRAVPGRGVRGVVDGQLVVVGGAAFVAEALPEAVLPDQLSTAREAAEAAGHSTVLVAWDNAVRAVLAVSDEPRPTSAAAVTQLRRLGLRPMLVSGDNQRATAMLADAVGIAGVDVHADMGPEAKAIMVERLQRGGAAVAMVGDGVNDAAALARADLGIAMGSGTDAAMHAADITLMRSDPAAVVDAVRLARRTYAIIRGNLGWAFGYNVVLIPLAAAGLLNPMVSGAAMASSSLLVVANSLRLRRFAPTEPSRR